MEHLVDEGEKLHDSFIESEVLLSFEQVVVLLVIRADDYEFLWPLFRDDDLDFVFEGVDFDVLNVGDIVAKEANVGFLDFGEFY
jgi:hypothetical protein